MKPKKLKRVCIKEELVALTGNYICALILNQFIYWSERTEDTDKFLQEEQTRNPDLDVELLHGWVFKKADQLASELMLDISAVTMRRYISRLVEQKLVNERNNPRQKQNQTLQYRPNIVEIQSQLQAIGYALEGYSLKPAPSANLQNEGSLKPPSSANLQNEGSTFKNDVSTFKNQLSTIDTEITLETTPEITHTNIERESEKKEFEPEAIKESAGVTAEKPVPDDRSTSLQDPLQTSRQPEDLSLGNNSAAATVITKESRTPTTWIGRSGAQKTEDRFNNVVPKWRNSHKTNDFKSSFLDYLIRLYLPDQDPYRTNGKKPTKGNANNWINAREFQGRDAEIESIYEDALLSMPAPNSVGDAVLQLLPQTWGEWATEAEKRRLMEFSQSAGSDILVHLRSGTSRLWSELRSLSWEEVTELCRSEVANC